MGERVDGETGAQGDGATGHFPFAIFHFSFFIAEETEGGSSILDIAVLQMDKQVRFSGTGKYGFQSMRNGKWKMENGK